MYIKQKFVNWRIPRVAVAVMAAAAVMVAVMEVVEVVAEEAAVKVADMVVGEAGFLGLWARRHRTVKKSVRRYAKTRY